MAAVLLQNEVLPCPSLEVLDSLWIPNSSPPPPPVPFHGARIVNFSEARGANKTREKDNSFFPQLDKEENGNNDDNYDGCCFHQPEKKRRLSTDQVQFLERSFEVENKLEPERKVQLAKELGLQPRQVAIWFQNRRARYKTKQLEKEYDCLKASYDKLNADYDSLFKENQKLKNEVQLLAEKLLLRDKGKAKSETAEKPLNASAVSPAITPNNNVAGSSSTIKQELDAASSAKSDVFDSDSPPHCCTDGHHSSLLEADHDSSDLVLEADRRSDFSQEEDDSLIQPLPYPPSSCFPKLEDDDECYDELQPNSCHLGFPVQDQAATWFWPY